MFEKLAKFRLVKPRHMAPHWLEAVHSNDNMPGRRRPASRRPSSRPVLACHWVFIDESRLECRWTVESVDETSVEQPDGHHITSKISGLPTGRVMFLNPERFTPLCCTHVTRRCHSTASPAFFIVVANDLQ